MARPGSRRRSQWRPVVRGAALAALGAAFVVPIFRKRLRIRPAVTATAVAAAPPALAVLARRTRLRDAALYVLQMWAFTMVHELPYDDPEALRRRLRVRYPIGVDRLLGAGELPNARLQRALSGRERASVVDHVMSWVHWAWFLEPHGAMVWILARHPERFARSARQMSAVYDLGCLGYFLVPTAPPWWAAEHGYADEGVRRIMVDVGRETWGRAWPRLYDSLGGNPWAAMPSLHFASSLMAAVLLSEAGAPESAAGWGYAVALAFALVYLGEHYVVDLLAGAGIVIAVRRGERLVEPMANAVSRALQRLERLANE